MEKYSCKNIELEHDLLYILRIVLIMKIMPNLTNVYFEYLNLCSICSVFKIISIEFRICFRVKTIRMLLLYDS